MAPFELITFDCYGTLIDWELGMKDSLQSLLDRKTLSLDVNGLLKRYGEIELEVEQESYRKYREVLSISVKRAFEERQIALRPNEERIFVDTLPLWPPFAETTEVLRKLKEKGYKLGILSNIDDDLIKPSIELMGVEFDGVITAEQVKSYKPSYAHWERMLELFKMPKGKVLHVGASYVHDIAPADELGFTTVWINRKGQQPKGPANPDYEFKTLNPLTEIL